MSTNNHIVRSKLKRSFAVILCLTAGSTAYAYNGYEHYVAGSKLTLRYLDESGNEFSESSSTPVLINSKSGTNATFGLTFPLILYLAGDFIGDPKINISGNVTGDLSISTAITNNEELTQQQQQTITDGFEKNFTYLYGTKYYKGKLVGSFIPNINIAVQEILTNNASQIFEGYQLKVNNDKLYNCYTGGPCPSTTVDLIADQGLYLATSSKGADHFGEFAAINYLTGHKLALQTALKATTNESLNLAYAYEAYADHYLSDSFTPGHIRTPIFALSQLQNETLLSKLQEILNSLGLQFSQASVLLSFAKIMHEVENEQGLKINTYRGLDQNITDWQAFGDGYYFTKRNANNVTQLHNALQHGIEQVFEAYKINNKMEEQSTFINSKMKEMQTWLPNLSYIRRSTKNNSPQFFVLNVKKDGDFNKQLFENGFRDYPDGSTGSICAFGRNAGILLGPETGGTVRKLIKSYCLSEASGFAKVWDYKDGTNNQINIYSSDGLRIYVNGSGGTGYVKVNTMNQQQVYVKPTVEDKSQNEKCTFKYPILVKRYGMYTSLDKYSGNTAVSFGLYLGRDILTCTGAKDYMVYYSAASINYNNYFGFIDPYIGSVFAGRIPISPYASYNVKLCPASNGNPAYLSHLDNLCMEWE